MLGGRRRRHRVRARARGSTRPSGRSCRTRGCRRRARRALAAATGATARLAGADLDADSELARGRPPRRRARPPGGRSRFAALKSIRRAGADALLHLATSAGSATSGAHGDTRSSADAALATLCKRASIAWPRRTVARRPGTSDSERVRARLSTARARCRAATSAPARRAGERDRRPLAGAETACARARAAPGTSPRAVSSRSGRVAVAAVRRGAGGRGSGTRRARRPPGGDERLDRPGRRLRVGAAVGRELEAAVRGSGGGEGRRRRGRSGGR